MSLFKDMDLISTGLSDATLKALREHLESDQSDHSYNISENDVNPRNLSNLSVNGRYKLKSYWDDRFADEGNFEWLLTFSQLRKSLLTVLQSIKRMNNETLIVGCGNSTFSADLYDEYASSSDGALGSIVNIDFSETVILKMRELHSILRPKMSWLTMDMTNLTFDSNKFDIILDKAAMDALCVDEGDVWYPEAHVIESVTKMCESVSRVLKPSGIFIQISFQQPHFRTKYLMNKHREENYDPYHPCTGFCDVFGWDVSFAPIEVEEGCLNYYMYIMRKRGT